jgi:hypothetical protein
MPMPPASGRSPPPKIFSPPENADPDISILKDAKAECAKLQ